MTYGQIVLSTEGGQPVCAALHAAQLSAMVCLRVGAYYLARGVGSGAKKWLFFGEGKAWCLSAKDCLGRTKAPDGRGGWMASNGAALRTLTKPSNQRAHTDRPKCRNAHTLRFTLFCAARLKTDFALLDCSAPQPKRTAPQCRAMLCSAHTEPPADGGVPSLAYGQRHPSTL